MFFCFVFKNHSAADFNARHYIIQFEDHNDVTQSKMSLDKEEIENNCLKKGLQ